MEDGSQQGTNSQQSSVHPVIAHQKVLQPSESFVNEVKASQQSVSNQIRPIQQNTPQTVSPESDQSVQSAQPEFAYNEPRPTKNQMPVGMSASQLGFSQTQSETSRKTIFKRIVVAAVVLAAVTAGILVYRSVTGYGTIKVHSSYGFTYSVTYNKLFSEVSIGGKIYLQGKDKSGNTMLMHVGKVTQDAFDCRASTGISTIIAKSVIEGQQHNLCHFQPDNAYVVNFTHNGTWYYLVIKPKDQSQTIDQETVKMIASSINVSQ
jgi:hypothetical protein